MLKFEEIRTIVKQVTYKPEWGILVQNDGRIFIQVRACTVNTITGVLENWKGGKKYLSPHMCKQEIVGACFAIIKEAEEHEMREWFRYQGASIFNPHLNPDALVKLASKAKNFNCRDNSMETGL